MRSKSTWVAGGQRHKRDGPRIGSMKITQDVRDYAAKLGVDEQAAL